MHPIYFARIQCIYNAESLYLSSLLSGALLARNTRTLPVIDVEFLFFKSSVCTLFPVLMSWTGCSKGLVVVFSDSFCMSGN